MFSCIQSHSRCFVCVGMLVFMLKTKPQHAFPLDNGTHGPIPTCDCVPFPCLNAHTSTHINHRRHQSMRPILCNAHPHWNYMYGHVAHTQGVGLRKCGPFWRACHRGALLYYIFGHNEVGGIGMGFELYGAGCIGRGGGVCMWGARINQEVEDTNGVTGVLNVCQAASSQGHDYSWGHLHGNSRRWYLQCTFNVFFWKGLHWLPVIVLKMDLVPYCCSAHEKGTCCDVVGLKCWNDCNSLLMCMGTVECSHELKKSLLICCLV